MNKVINIKALSQLTQGAQVIYLHRHIQMVQQVEPWADK